MEYKKFISSSDTGMVVAEIYAMTKNGGKSRRVGLDFFHRRFWESKEGAFERAHAWADKHIEIVKKYEEVDE